MYVATGVTTTKQIVCGLGSAFARYPGAVAAMRLASAGTFARSRSLFSRRHTPRTESAHFVCGNAENPGVHETLAQHISVCSLMAIAELRTQNQRQHAQHTIVVTLMEEVMTSQKNRVWLTLEDDVFEQFQSIKQKHMESDSGIGNRSFRVAFFLDNHLAVFSDRFHALKELVEDLAKRVKKLRESDLVLGAFSKEAEDKIKALLNEQSSATSKAISSFVAQLDETLKQLPSLFKIIEGGIQKLHEKQDHHSKVIVQFSEGLQRLQNTIVRGQKA